MQTKVIQYRKNNKLSQTEIAKKLEIASKSYWRKEKGITKFNEKEIKKLMEIFNVQFNELF